MKSAFCSYVIDNQSDSRQCSGAALSFFLKRQHPCLSSSIIFFRQVRFAKYKQFCDDTSAEKKSLIEDANGMIEQLQVRRAALEARRCSSSPLRDFVPRQHTSSCESRTPPIRVLLGDAGGASGEAFSAGEQRSLRSGSFLAQRKAVAFEE